MCLKNFLLKQTSSKINNSGEKFCNNLSCFFLTPITPVLLSGNLLNYTGCSIITSKTIRVKSRILKQFLSYLKTLSNLEQCPTWVRSSLSLRNHSNDFSTIDKIRSSAFSTLCIKCHAMKVFFISFVNVKFITHLIAMK